MSSLLAIHLRVNVTKRTVQDQSGRVWAAEDIPVFRAEGLIHRLTCVYTDPDTGDEMPFPFSATMTFKFGIKDSDNLAATEFLAFADNAEFNLVADWAQVNPAQGRICYRFSSNTTNFATFLTTAPAATTSGKTARAEVEVKEVGEEPFALFQTDVQCHPDVIRGTEGSPAPGSPAYATAAELSAAVGSGISFKRVGDKCLVLIDGLEAGSFEKPT